MLRFSCDAGYVAACMLCHVHHVVFIMPCSSCCAALCCAALCHARYAALCCYMLLSLPCYPMTELQCELLRDFDEWWSKSGSSSLCSTPHADSATGMKVHDNAAFRRTGSGEEVLQSQDSKAGIKEAMARESAEGEKVSNPQETAPVASQTVPTDTPTTLVAVEVYRMGLFTYKGISEKVQLCQIFPTSLSERRQAYSDTAFHGKAVCSKRDDSLALSVQVKLPEVLQLPLSAEPPLCINMVLQSSQSSSISKQRRHSHLRT